MLLAIDIGNTNITFGLFKGKRLLKRMDIPTSSINSKNNSIQKIKKAFLRYKIEAILICSVVPKAEQLLTVIARKLFKVKPIILGKDINVPIKNLYKKPKQVGQDRLVNTYAGYTFYKTPLIIIDFGTAITFDIVSKSGAYLGGIITPGIELALNALSEKTALLPKIKLRKIPSIIGKSTPESMASGAFYGFSSMCDGLVARLKKRYGFNFNVVATGGNAYLIAPFTASIRRVDSNLTLKGINLVYQNLASQKLFNP